MYTYILRRVLLLIPTLLIVSVIVFLSVRLIPGDVIDVMFAQMSVSGRANLPSREALEAALGLDRPLHVQYLSWLGDIVLRGDFGDPLMAIEPVAVLIRQRIGVTLELGAMAIVVSLLVSLPVGIYSAVRQDSVADYLARSVAIVLVSVPPFWTGTMVMIYPSVWWGWAPSIELNPLVEDPLGHLGHVLLPAVVLGTALAGLSMRMTRTMMLEVLRADYVRTAWSKGLGERLVVIRHAVEERHHPGAHARRGAASDRDRRGGDRGGDLPVARHGPPAGGRRGAARLPAGVGHQRGVCRRGGTGQSAHRRHLLVARSARAP